MNKIFFFIIFIFTTHNAHCETIELLSGKIINGEVLERTDKYLKINNGTKIFKIQKKFINDGGKQKRKKRKRNNRKNKNNPLSIKEKLRAIREAEDLNKKHQQQMQKLIDSKKETKMIKDSTKNKKQDENKTMTTCQKIVPVLKNCSISRCYQPHPDIDSFSIEHFVKGFYSPDGNGNKCNYHQSLPSGNEGDVLECHLPDQVRYDLIISIQKGASLAFSKNAVLQKAKANGHCRWANFSQLYETSNP